MLIKTLPVGQLETNCYVVTDERSLLCAVIDPGDESNTILDYLEDNRLRCEAILLTHGHYDHVGAVAAVAEETGATVYMCRRDDLGGRDPRMPLTLPAGGEYIDEGDAMIDRWREETRENAPSLFTSARKCGTMEKTHPNGRSQ